MQSGWEAAVSLVNASPADSLIVNQQHDKQQAGSEPKLPDINTTQSGKQSYMAPFYSNFSLSENFIFRYMHFFLGGGGLYQKQTMLWTSKEKGFYFCLFFVWMHAVRNVWCDTNLSMNFSIMNIYYPIPHIDNFMYYNRKNTGLPGNNFSYLTSL